MASPEYVEVADDKKRTKLTHVKTMVESVYEKFGTNVCIIEVTSSY